jgi:hypothetical protein
VVRVGLTISLAFVLAAVLAAGSCLSCAELLRPAHNGCCHHENGNCEKRAPFTPQCAAPLLDLSKVEKPAPVSGPAASWASLASATSIPAPLSAPQILGAPPPPFAHLHSPPDLYLLHSSLTI